MTTNYEFLLPNESASFSKVVYIGQYLALLEVYPEKVNISVVDDKIQMLIETDEIVDPDKYREDLIGFLAENNIEIIS